MFFSSLPFPDPDNVPAPPEQAVGGPPARPPLPLPPVKQRLNMFEDDHHFRL